MSAAADGELVPEMSCERRGSWFVFRSVGAFEWTQIRLPVRGLAPELAGLKIVHLSDFHTRGSWSPGYGELVDRVNSATSDLVLVTGDFIDDKNDHRAGLPVLRKFLPRLKSRLGVYGILGNHDVDLIEPYLIEMGVNVIDGRRVVLEGSGQGSIELIGLPGRARVDLDRHFIASVPQKSPGTLRIVMSHYPDHVKRVRPLAADLFLAGHTHGGQCCLPGGWPIITHDRLPRRLSKGVHRYEGTWLVVSRGIGFAGMPLRVFCPGEVGEIVVTSNRKQAGGIAREAAP
jgi:predicted MPP superfamily phosphohydrolase